VKKEKLNKKFTSIGKLKQRADRALQDHFRRIKTRCELCPNPYQVAHHFIPKSSSNYLRYDEKNLIFVCQPCHSKFHSFPDPLIAIRVEKLRGKAWVKWIENHRHLLKKDSRIELNKILEKYKSNS